MCGHPHEAVSGTQKAFCGHHASQGAGHQVSRVQTPLRLLHLFIYTPSTKQRDIQCFPAHKREKKHFVGFHKVHAAAVYKA